MEYWSWLDVDIRGPIDEYGRCGFSWYVHRFRATVAIAARPRRCARASPAASAMGSTGRARGQPSKVTEIMCMLTLCLFVEIMYVCIRNL